MTETTEQPTSAPPSRRLTVHVDQLDPNPFQPRRVLDTKHILALADSITAHLSISKPGASIRSGCPSPWLSKTSAKESHRAKFL